MNRLPARRFQIIPKTPALAPPLPAILLAATVCVFSGCAKSPEDHARIARDNNIPVEKRLESVRSLGDQVLLADLALNARNSRIRIAAVEKLADQRLLADFIKKTADRKAGENAIAKLTDQQALESIARDNNMPVPIRQKAAAGMTGETRLARFARETGTDFRDRDGGAVARAAVEKLTDQALLAGVAREVAVRRVPVEAFSRLADQSLLATLALRAQDREMRVFAVEKLTSQPQLELVATQGAEGGDLPLDEREGIIVGSPEYIRRLAVGKLDNQSLLAEIVTKQTEHKYVRQAAVRRITDQSLLAGIAKKTGAAGAADHRDDGIAALVETRLAELRLLARINGNDSGAPISASGVERLADQQLLADIARSTFGQDVRAAAVNQLADQPLLADIAGSLLADKDIRLLSVARLTDQQLLAVIAKRKESDDLMDEAARFRPEGGLLNWTWWGEALKILAVRREAAAVREASLDRLTDVQLLADVAKNAGDADMRRLAAQRLDDRQLLAGIAQNDDDDEVVRAVLDKLGALEPDSQTPASLARAASAEARLWAAWRISDRTLLGELSRNDKDTRVRTAASEKLSGNPQTAARGNIMTLMEEGKILVETTSNPRGARDSYSAPHLRYRDDKDRLLIKITKMVPWPLEVIVPAGSHFVYEKPWHDKSEYRGLISTVDVTIAVTDAKAGALVPVVFADSVERIAQTNGPNFMRLGYAAPDIARTSRVLDLAYWTVSLALRRHPREDDLRKLMTHPDWKISHNGRGEIRVTGKLYYQEMEAAILIVAGDAGHDGIAGAGVTYSKIVTHDMARAMQVCAEAGIDIKQKRIWGDREKILAGLEPGKLRGWLEAFIKS